MAGNPYYYEVMRNQPKPLDRMDRMRQDHNLKRLVPLVETDTEITVHYRKRDNSTSSSTGTVAFFNGKPGMDTGSVTIADPIKGNRTINLHRIFSVEGV